MQRRTGITIRNEPIWLDVDLLRVIVNTQIPRRTGQGVTGMGETPFSEVLQLNLGYKKIPKIVLLWEFTALVKLEFNNNFIEKIEGLDRLVNLTWLDLSSNKIEKIEGLESLQKLELLELSNNRITVIENMDTLENLTHVFIANNLLEHLDNVRYLVRFKKLFSINLFGNPLSTDDNYRFFIAAYFSNLPFLDNIFLDKKTKDEASIKYAHALEAMKREELQFQKAEEADKKQEAEAKLHSDAFVDHLKGSHLFKSMLKDDPEAETLHSLSEVADLLQTFEKQMEELCVQIFEVGLAEHKRREIEVNAFFRGQTEALINHQQKSLQMLTTLEQQHKERIEELQQSSDPELHKGKISDCNSEINQLCSSLMALEFQLASQMEGIIKKFDISISDMVGNFTETIQGLFMQCRDLEDNYYEKVREIALATLESVAKNEQDEYLSNDAIMLFTDRDTVMDALTAGHDNHLVKINDRETLLVTRVSAWKVTLMKGIQEKEVKQKRTRIADIHRYVDHLREQLEELQ